LKRFIVTLWTAFCAALLSLGAAHAQLEIDITKGNIDPTPIAVPSFLGSDNQTRDLGKQISEVIRADLERSGLFRSLDPASFLETQTNIDYQPTFADWRVIKAEALVSGRIVRESPTKIRVEFRLWDIFAGNQLAGLRFATTPDNWRRTAHKASDAIYKALTGEEGYFDSRIVFVDEKGGKVPQFLLAGSDLVLTPRFSPSSQKITFMSYENVKPQVYLLDIETGRRELLGNFPGMTFAPRFAPDGNALIMAMESKGGNSDIYIMDLRSRSTTRLTTDPSIDVSGSFSPDGRKIVFNSDRGGSPQLYTMNANGTNKKRISFKIAFVKSQGGQFSIGVMDPDGSNERQLTQSYSEEGPTWSPNGRVIIFSRETKGRNGSNSVWSVDLTGQNLRKVNTPGNASDPAWSPLLP